MNCCDGKSWCNFCNPRPEHIPDTAMMSADVRNLSKVAERYRQLAKRNPDHELADVYEKLFMQIERAASALAELRGAILDGKV